MIKTIIIDDETPAIDELEYLLSKHSKIEVVATFLNPVKALEYLLTNEIDVCFVDISMPLMNGFEFANAMLKLKKPPALIFATAYDEYAIQAFEVNAVDYILKPISEERLSKTCQKIVDNVLSTNEVKINNLAKELECVDRLPLWKNDRISIVCIEKLLYLEVSDSKTYVHAIDTEYVTNDSLSYYENLLPSNKFFRAHRNFIINTNQIAEVIPWFNNTYVVKLNGTDKEIPISRRNLKAFKKRLNI